MLNRVILIGRLATDPELKYTPSGIAVTQFRLAVNRPLSAEARQSGQEKQADFFSVVAWRQSAEFAANYLRKGRLISVEGRLQAREFVTQDGQKRRDVEVVSDNLTPLERAKDDAEGGGGGGYARNGGGRDEHAGVGGGGHYDDEEPAPAPPPARMAAPASSGGARRPAPAGGGGRAQPAPADDEMDDPFADN